MEDSLVENRDILTHMNEVYEEREHIYEEREKEYKRHRKLLSDLTENAKKKLKEVSDTKKELDEKGKTLEQKAALLDEREKNIKNSFAQLEETKQNMEVEKQTFENEKNRSISELRFQKEQLKNEQIKVQQLQEELQTQLTILGIFDEVSVENPLEYLKNTLSLADSAENVTELQEENVKLMTELDELRKSYSSLQKELKEKEEERNKLVSMFAKSYSNENQNLKADEEIEGEIESSKEDWIEHIEDRQVNENEEIYEELTSEVLKRYITKNEPRCSDLEIKHAESGEQLHFNVNDKKYVFAFEESPFFEISVHRKNSSRLKKIIAHYNKMYEDVKFTFENERVYATAHFDKTTQMKELMDKVWKISQHFE